MTRIRVIVALLSAVAFCHVTPEARACPDSNLRLGLADAIAKAISHDPRITAADADAARAKAMYAQARSPLFPQVDSFARGGVGDGVLVDNQVDNRTALQLSQALIDLGLGGSIKSARAQAEGARAEAMRLRREVARDTAVAYGAAAQHADRLSLLKDYAAQLDGHAPARDEAFSLGAMTADERSQWQSEEIRIRTQVFEETAGLSNALVTLGHLTGVPGVCIVPESIEADIEDRRMVDPSIYAVPMIEFNPRLVTASARISQSEGQVAEARLSRWPRLVLSGFWANDYNSRTDKWDFRHRVGLDLRMPVLSGGRYRAELQAAQAELTAAEARYAQTRDDLEEYLTNTLTRIDMTGQKLDAFATLSRSRLQMRDLTRESLDMMAATLDDLDRAEGSYVAAALSEIDARATLRQMWTDLLSEAGLFEPPPPPEPVEDAKPATFPSHLIGPSRH